MKTNTVQLVHWHNTIDTTPLFRYNSDTRWNSEVRVFYPEGKVVLIVGNPQQENASRKC